MKRDFVYLLFFILFFIGALILGVDTALSQDASLGAVRGRLFDADGAQVSNATVTLLQPSRGLSVTQSTGPEGEFVFSLVRPGEYEVLAETRHAHGSEDNRRSRCGGRSRSVPSPGVGA